MAESAVTASAGAAEKSGVDSSDGASAQDYSQTNIQVQGVDEPDIVKNDGKYIYTISSGNVVIINAFPPESMDLVGKIEIKNPINLFIKENQLIIFSNQYSGVEGSLVSIYDVSDKSNPELIKEIEVNGYYVDARMIENHIYLISNRYTGYGDVVLPYLMVDGVQEKIAATDISYFPYPDSGYSFTSILSVNIEDYTYDSETYLLGSSYTIFVSEDNIYLTGSKRLKNEDYFGELVEEVLLPILPEKQKSEIKDLLDSDDPFYIVQREINEVVEDYSMSLTGKEKAEFDNELSERFEEFSISLQKRLEQTIIHKIKIDEGQIEYLNNGAVPGYVLNQFSMDEHEGYFRIATTTGNSWGRSDSLNHMYVLDENLKIVGEVEDLAKGERIYSVRFLGDRAYMVTFRQVDPLFVVDLTDPTNPEVLGQLKVTGYSSYLHPYDENHVIGIGKEATEEGRVQGLKIALFDVSDVENPIERAKYEVKQQWSDSNALYDHKAFLFDKEKELLVLPVSYSVEVGVSEGPWRYPIYNYWQGAYVFNINEEEISVRGKVAHSENEKQDYSWLYQIQRSLYMDDTLYTISSQLVKANNLDTLEEINSVELPVPDYRDYPILEYGDGIGDGKPLPAVEEEIN